MVRFEIIRKDVEVAQLSKLDFEIIYTLQGTMIEQGTYILIAAGAFIFIISFLGYCGAINSQYI